jgi:photosynthetic reaction center H subunit
MRGAITEHIDVAQVALYAFWLFFAALVFYLSRENRREGFPMESDSIGKDPAYSPSPKIFRLYDGRTETQPRKERGYPPMRFRAVDPWPGAPIEPVGDPMLANVGPGSYVHRADVAERTTHGGTRIAPLRVANDFYLDDRDPDPRGMDVVGADGLVAGKVRDIWVDRSEFLIRYLEVELSLAEGLKTVLLPMPFAVIDEKRGHVKVHSILASQFANAPSLANPDQVTLLEEDRVVAYYGAGKLYATPQRAEPLL